MSRSRRDDHGIRWRSRDGGIRGGDFTSASYLQTGGVDMSWSVRFAKRYEMMITLYQRSVLKGSGDGNFRFPMGDPISTEKGCGGCPASCADHRQGGR